MCVYVGWVCGQVATQVVCSRVHLLLQVWLQVGRVELRSHAMGSHLIWRQALQGTLIMSAFFCDIFIIYCHRFMWTFLVLVWEEDKCLWVNCVACVFLCVCVFMQGLKGCQILELIETNKRLDRPDQCPPGVFDIMMRCWRHEWVDQSGLFVHSLCVNQIRETLSSFLLREYQCENICGS